MSGVAIDLGEIISGMVANSCTATKVKITRAGIAAEVEVSLLSLTNTKTGESTDFNEPIGDYPEESDFKVTVEGKGQDDQSDG